MAYTDKQMRAFSQIAYADFTEAYNFLTSSTKRDSFTIEELEIAARAINKDVDLSMLYCVTEEEKRTWKISAVHDTNPQNGFCGCIIETAPGEATLAFRGSEGMDNAEGGIHDWGASDFGLLNSVQTRQQKEVDRFLKKYKEQINGYDSITLTGHSLGGNLAEYATLVSHKYGFDDKVDRCVSLDGPGFSNEFLTAHMLDIARMNGKITHYRWSPVGSLLFDLPGVNYIVTGVSNDANEKDDEEYECFTRHDTKYMEFDENGNLVRGEKDDVAKALSAFSKYVDAVPGSLPFNIDLILSPVLTIISVIYGNKEGIEKFFNDFAQAAKTTYKNIVKAFNKIFSLGLEYFRVDTGLLNSDVNEIRNYINTVRNNVSEMFSSVQQLSGMWTGPANKAFTDKLAEEKQEIDDFLSVIEGYVNRLENAAGKYSSCESRARELAASVRA